MGNERKTEEIVRSLLDAQRYYSKSEITVELQQSDNPKINKLLKTASKSGKGKGFPEYIISSSKYPNLIIVIECKASVLQHCSEDKNQPKKYAVDGALLYASYLKKEYDVITIGISGEKESELLINHYLYLNNATKYDDFVGNKILRLDDYYNSYVKSPQKFRQDYDNLIKYSKDLNETLHAKKITEKSRSLLISGILIALKNTSFKTSFKTHKTARQITDQLTTAISYELNSSNIEIQKIEVIQQAFSFIKTNATLINDKKFVIELIEEIDNEINSFIRTHKYFDTIGHFYIEFLRYANNDKGLGIVLTPPHITELFVELAGVNKDSIVLDNCCGTAGFLICALRKMIADAKGDTTKEKEIKQNQIVGTEYQNSIYTLAVSNMILHGDGKSNIFSGDCFSKDSIKKVRDSFKPTVGLLNPPYKTKKSDIEEFEFILNNLSMLQRGGKCIAIIPMSCVLAQKGEQLVLKKQLMANHTLEAVMSMPDELFHNSKVGVIASIIVITAHNPHPSNKKVWFGYWKDDSFVKVKNKGRIDRFHTWEKIKNEWLSAFINKEIIIGKSITQKVTAEDEWCAEAYMETDYSKLSEKDFILSIKKYITYKELNL